MIGPALEAKLASNSSIAAIVGTRIVPQMKNMPFYTELGEAERPYITYAVLSGDSGKTLNGTTGIRRARVQIRCWGDLYKDVDGLRDLITADGFLDGQAFTSAGVKVLWCGLGDFGDDFEPPFTGDDVGTQQTSCDFAVCFQPA